MSNMNNSSEIKVNSGCAKEIKNSPFKKTVCGDQPVLTMSFIGVLGQFGNQIFQYAFLRICAGKNSARVECPPWIGQTLFGHNDLPISRQLPAAIERWECEKDMYDHIPESIPYIEKKTGFPSSRVGPEFFEEEIVNVDLWGYFQLHTRFFRPYRKYFRSLFQAENDLRNVLEDGFNVLRSKGKTIVGIHIRRGDYMTLSLSSYTFVVPVQRWCDWLDNVWNELEDPILFICSDDIAGIIDGFEKYSPMTWKDLGVKLPERMQHAGIEFYIDFFVLSKCDVVGISNSSFSFAACLLNDCARIFVRPYWDSSLKFMTFDPWNSKPLLHMGSDDSQILKSWRDALHIAYVTQGLWAMLRCLFIYIPKQCFDRWRLRCILGYKTKGMFGVLKSLLYSLGWKSVWKTVPKSH